MMPCDVKEENAKGECASDESVADRVTLVAVTESNVDTLGKLNAVLFPITYQKKFYLDCLSCGAYTVMAQMDGSIVAAICCRLEEHRGVGIRLYIMTLGVLAPYRRLGVAKTLLDHAMQLARKDPRLVDVYLHVQVGNEPAIGFYERHGFELIATLKNYYKRIQPADCHVFARSVHDWPEINRSCDSSGIPQGGQSHKE